MELKIDLNKAKQSGLKLHMILFLKLIHLKINVNDYMEHLTKDEVNRLISYGYMDDDYNLTEKYYQTFEDSIPVENDIEKFVQQYRSLFPSGSNSSGYPFRGSKADCEKKMKKFMKNNPNITKEQIIQATRKYANLQYVKGNVFMQTAAYFIEKDGISNLLGCCEALNNKDEVKGNNEIDLNS